MAEDLEVYAPTGSVPDVLRPADLLARVDQIREIVDKVMKKDVHYGKVPGCGDKPTLLKPGGEILALTFHLGLMPTITTEDMGGGHRDFIARVEVVNLLTGQIVGAGEGSCSTMESKYRYRKGARVCPECEEPSIIKGLEKYGGGWVCYKKTGGCGVKWADGTEQAQEFESQPTAKTEHPDPADYYNTCRKMALKRGRADAILTATGASEFFTQDMDDDPPPAATGATAAPAGDPKARSEAAAVDGPTSFYKLATALDVKGKDWLADNGYDTAAMKKSDWTEAAERLQHPTGTPSASEKVQEAFDATAQEGAEGADIPF